jgi:lipopolysaccharide/colanic/teichoic acid biosynthesis glycosyltransferase
MTSTERPAAAGPVEQPRFGYSTVKRAGDVVVSAILLLLLSPVLALIALAIKLYSPGPVLFVQERVGYDRRHGRVRPFKLYKFRSMHANADPAVHIEHMQKLILNGASAAGPGGTNKLVRDHRVTGVGRVLRKTSLDELPQLLNVLFGDMSLVGPRPALPYEVEHYEEWHRRRLEAVPGLTGWWQVNGRGRSSFDDGICMDIYYVDNISLALDLKILLMTPWAAVSGKGAG